jgi:hypothetical protein
MIAKNRYKLLGYCEITTEKKELPSPPPLYNNNMLRGAYVFYFIIISIYFFMQFAYSEGLRTRLFALMPDYYSIRIQKKLRQFIYQLGMDTPLVFNHTDLMMNEKWFVLYRIKDGKKELVPVLDEYGGRLHFFLGCDPFLFGNHGSDLLYYATTLQYRRQLIRSEVHDFHESGHNGDKYIRKIMEIDRRKNKLSDNTPYYYEVRKDKTITGFSGDEAAKKNRFKYEVLLSKAIN